VEGEMKDIEHILVPTDFSDSARNMLDTAIGYAQKLGARIHLLHSCNIWVLSMMPGAIATPDEFWERVEAAGRDDLEEVRRTIVEAGVACDCYLEKRDPVDAILLTAREIPADLIIMGTRGLTGFKHTLLGSTAERTLRLAPCPVMTVALHSG
jgi:nucleotide-binding universal stress UspA family protein